MTRVRTLAALSTAFDGKRADPPPPPSPSEFTFGSNRTTILLFQRFFREKKVEFASSHEPYVSYYHFHYFQVPINNGSLGPLSWIKRLNRKLWQVKNICASAAIKHGKYYHRQRFFSRYFSGFVLRHSYYRSLLSR